MRVTLVSTLSYVGALGSSTNAEFLKEFYLPIGLLTVARILEENACLVTIIDPNMVAWRERLTDQNALRQSVVNHILESEPAWVGFTTMCDSYHHTLCMAMALKREKAVRIVLGGPQASAVAHETLRSFSCIDYVIRGEAEASLAEFVSAMAGVCDLSEVPNLVYRHDNSLPISNTRAPLLENLDDAPIPAFEHYAFLRDQLHFLPIEAGRGCPFHCDFCSTALFFDRRYRLKSGKRLVMEMLTLESIFGQGHCFRLIHDMLTVDKRLVRSMCAELRQLDPIRQWSCSARADCVDDELLRDMALAGCNDIYFGIETGSQKMQAKIKKRLNLGKVFPRVETARKLGMDATLSFICGFPDETLDDLNSTLSMIFASTRRFGHNVNLQLHLLAPYVGTELYEMNESSLKFDGYFSDQTGQSVENDDAHLIKENPSLFSNFYYSETKNYQRDILFGIDTFVYVLLRDFPLTILFLQRSGFSPIEIYLAWQAIALRTVAARQLAVVSASVRTTRETFTQYIEDIETSLSPESRILLSRAFAYEGAIADLVDEQQRDLRKSDRRFSKLRILQSDLEVETMRSYLAGDLNKLPEVRSAADLFYVVQYRSSRHINAYRVTHFLATVLNLVISGKAPHEALPAMYPQADQKQLQQSIDNALSTIEKLEFNLD